MAFHHRKLSLPPKIHQSTNTQFVQVNKHFGCLNSCDDPLPLPLPPPLPPPPPPPPMRLDDDNQIPPFLLLMFCIIGGAFLVVCYYILANKCHSNSTNSRRRNPPSLDATHEDFTDENHGPVVNHPIWLINTVGLQQAIIDSIAVFKYKRDEGLIEGTECSVCLNEFQEDESLRLLPKCSHAFHVPCIDTWLSSHKNCPLCRSPIICDSNNAHVNTVPPNLPELSSREETRVENLESQNGLGNHLVGDGDDNNEIRDEEGKIAEILEMNSRHQNARNHREGRVLSDLANHSAKVEEELAVVRRSISMDSASASMIYAAVAKISVMEQEGCSDARLVEAKKPNSQKVCKRGKRSNSSIYRVMKSCSFGRSLQNGSVCMKRSFSSSGKITQPRYSRSQDSILPHGALKSLVI